MRITETVERLCRRYGTRDPFEIADQRRILIIFESLGEIRGYCSTAYRQKFIHINQDLTEEQQRFTCCHELGHIILHPGLNTPFLRENTLFSVSKLETEANRFAICMLCDQDAAQEMIQGGRQVSDIPAPWRDLVQWRLEQIHCQCRTL